MSTLHDLLAEHADLAPGDVDHLHRLAGDWQLIADLSFADLLLWVATRDGRFVCVAQVRPTTAPTTYTDDQVGRLVSPQDRPHLAVAAGERRIWREGDPVWSGNIPVRFEAVPVVRSSRVIAVVGRDTNLANVRVPSQLELAYLEAAGDLCQMVADGTFPLPTNPGETTSAPRVGDGLVRLDRTGTVSYASPNAQSAARRLGLAGDLLGTDLAVTLARMADDPLQGGEAAGLVTAALAGRAPRRLEIEAHGAVVLLRALPLLPGGQPVGALVLVRDVTELRHRDRQLLGKDATIREIHHRVKNNLQTVAALLRLQARRVDSGQARAALTESVRRVASIAVVHEILSASPDEAVPFDEVVDKVASMVAEVASPESSVRVHRTGGFGALPAQVATPLVMVLTELLQNAVEHGFPGGRSGEVTVTAARDRDRLRVLVRDDGAGLPPGFDPAAGQRLGLQIVRALIAGELGGDLALRRRPEGGTEVAVSIPLSPAP